MFTLSPTGILLFDGDPVNAIQFPGSNASQSTTLSVSPTGVTPVMQWQGNALQLIQFPEAELGTTYQATLSYSDGCGGTRSETFSFDGYKLVTTSCVPITAITPGMSAALSGQAGQSVVVPLSIVGGDATLQPSDWTLPAGWSIAYDSGSNVWNATGALPAAPGSLTFVVANQCSTQTANVPFTIDTTCDPITGVTWVYGSSNNCNPITAVTVSPDPLELDALDSGIISIVLTGGYNDGTDTITKQWDMPAWMNGGDVLWNATDGYHIPYTVPADFWTANASPVNMQVHYTASNNCTSTPVQSNDLNIDLVDDGGSSGGGGDPTESCAACDFPNPRTLTLSEVFASMQGPHAESPVTGVANTSGARFTSGYIVQGAQPNGGSVPPWHPDSGQNLNYDRVLPFYHGFTMAGHPNGSNTGVLMSPFILDVLENGVWVRKGVYTWNIDFSDRTIAPFVVVNGFNEWEVARGNCRGYGMDGHDGRPLAGVGDGISAHGWGSFVSINPSITEGFRVRCMAKLTCRNPDGPDDRSAARYQLGVGLDLWATPRGTYPASSGSSKMIQITNNWQYLEYSPLDTAGSVDTSGPSIEGRHTMSTAEFAASNPSLVFNP